MDIVKELYELLDSRYGASQNLHEFADWPSWNITARFGVVLISSYGNKYNLRFHDSNRHINLSKFNIYNALPLSEMLGLLSKSDQEFFIFNLDLFIGMEVKYKG